MKNDRKINFITLSSRNDWGLYHRRNEAIIWELSRRDDVESVMHVEHISIKTLFDRMKKWLSSKDKAIKDAYYVQLKKGFSMKPVLSDNDNKYFIYSIVHCYSGNVRLFRKIFYYIEFVQYKAINRFFCKEKENIVLIGYPSAKYLTQAVRMIDHDILIADIVDDNVKRTNDVRRKRRVLERYKKILPQCRWVFSTSPSINDSYRKIAHQDISFLPNGVDFKLYRNVTTLNGFTTNNRKVVGYVGNLNQTIDDELLEYLITTYSDVDFVIIGHTNRKATKELIDQLKKQNDNFHYLGERIYTEIPGYLSSFDVLINFKKNDHKTIGNDLMKIYEYLATGKPIVTTPISPADRFKDIIYIASDKVMFASYLKIALEENNEKLKANRIRASRDNSWSARAEVIMNKVSSLL